MQLTKSENTKYTAEQDKDAFVDYAFDWHDWLVGDDIIVDSQWSADEGITLSGASLKNPVTTIWVQGGEVGRWYLVTNTVTSAAGRIDQRTFRLKVIDEHDDGMEGTALFPDMGRAVEVFRRDMLSMAKASVLPDMDFSDAYIAERLRIAETEAERRLRVFFSETTVFAYQPTEQEITALEAEGKRWHEEPSYDYEPQMWTAEDWGYLVLRQRPVQKVEMCQFAYPSPVNGFFKVPMDWIRLDKKAGHVRFVPSGSTLGVAPIAGFILSCLGGGTMIPDMIQVRYQAGLKDVAKVFPDLVNVVQKMAILGIIKNAFMPSSGSISADGLSQSSSIQLADWQGDIDNELDHLSQQIHGVRMTIL